MRTPLDTRPWNLLAGLALASTACSGRTAADAGTTTSWTLAPEAIPELGAPDRTSEIDLAVRSRRLVAGSWVTDREARWFRLTSPFAAGWDRGWGFLWGS